MLESIIQFMSSVPWYWVLLGALFITFLENIFPPSPSDSVLIFTGTMIGLGSVDFPSLLIASTIGSVIGFTLMFYLGSFVGKRIIKSKKFPFITEENIVKPHKWLEKYGYFIIVTNRFLSGTRGVVSFLAGMLKMPPTQTITLASVSAVVWNFILIYIGTILGNNWRQAGQYVELYGIFMIPVIVCFIIYFAVKYFNNYQKNKKAQLNSEE